MRKPVYLDHQATTPADPRVVQAMLPYFGEKFGNAASRSHSFGWEAEKAVERARRQVAELAGAAPREIVFTSGATESVNLAMKGVMEERGSGHLITMTTEHHAVLDTAARLERMGFGVTRLKPERDGRLDVERLRAAIRPETVLVSVMAANNEIGTVQPVETIGEICRERGAVFHCDAAQAVGKIAVNAARDTDLMSMSAHKLYGPKGVGALYVRRGRGAARLEAQMDGGRHEGGLRSGTLNVPAIVGFGEACRIAGEEMAAEAARLAEWRDDLLARLLAEIEGVTVNGGMEYRLPGNLNVSFGGVNADALLMKLPDVALSTGSACSSAVAAPSHVLRALGLDEAAARSAVRIGLGRFNTAEEMEYAAGRVIEAVRACYNARVFPVPQDPGNHYA